VASYRNLLEISYFENSENLGYDGNLRVCIARSSGTHCLIMGNDDLLCPGAIAELTRVVELYPSVGVVSRAYSIFTSDLEHISQTIVHFSDSRFFPRGPQSLVTLYRRVGVISGTVFRKDLADSVATDRWDGTLYYQLYLCGEIILRADGFYIAKPIVACRDGIAPDFGNSRREKEFYTPGRYTNEARLRMFGSQLEIVRDIERRHKVPVLDAVIKDLGNYSYFMLYPQRKQGIVNFARYYAQLGKLGFSRSYLYHGYFLVLLLLGDIGAERLLRSLRKMLSATPRFGKLYAGKPATQL
jgi:glycosyltransferase involved in cell wall biosynthesis